MNRLKRKIIVVCLVALVIILLIALYINLVSQCYKCEGTIWYVDKSSVLIVSPAKNTYSFGIKKAIIIDKEGKKIEPENLKKGDYIRVINGSGFIEETRLPDARLIQVVESDVEIEDIEGVLG